MKFADDVLDPDILTIGFARRFATYKRATLLLHDVERLARILNDADCPVQVIYAGKAHPHDDPGKQFIQQIVSLASQERFRRRLVFLEDYDMDVARTMLQGVDVWLNTPMRPHEASGTSGMKAAANGVLNLSILDGWWDEAYLPEIGWAIGRREDYDDPTYQNQVEADDLYGVLEKEVIPCFYERGADRLPDHWTDRMKASIASLCHYFNTHRMVGEYTERCYLPAAHRYRQLSGDGLLRANTLAGWKARVRKLWPQVKIEPAEGPPGRGLPVAKPFTVTTYVTLGELGPDDVSVELYLGRVDAVGGIVNGRAIRMEHNGPGKDGRWLYSAPGISCDESGLHGYTLRVVPHHPDLSTPFIPGLIVWA